LRADLAAWNRMLEGNAGALHTQVLQRLTLWQTDPDLAGLRDPQALDQLPPSEQEECRDLWQEVGGLCRSAQSALRQPSPKK
jgi:hypothetical protein